VRKELHEVVFTKERPVIAMEYEGAGNIDKVNENSTWVGAERIFFCYDPAAAGFSLSIMIR